MNECMHYRGSTIDWNYEKGYVKISMQKYIPALLQKLQHPKPASLNMLHILGSSQPMANAYKWQQLTNLKIIDSKGVRCVQSIVGSLLYQSRALDSTTMVALNKLGGEQAIAIEKT